MSIVRILLGIGGLGATAAGIWFGLDKKQENDRYQAKMVKFRETVKKVNGKLESYGESERLFDPEHWIWNKKLSAYESQGWSGRLQHIPLEIRKDPEAFKDFCFKSLEKNASDLDTIALSSGTLPSEKMFWDYCLAGNYELSQLSKK